MTEKNSLAAVLWDQVPTAMLLLDEAGSILESNRAAAELFSGALQSSRPLLSILSGEDRELLKSKLAWAIDRRERTEAEIHLPCPAGGEGRLVGVGLSPVVRGDSLQVLVLARDIAGARRVDRRYRDIFERTTEPILLTASDGSFIDCNPALEKLVGTTRERMRLDGAPPFRVDPVRLDAPGEWETRLSARDGTERHLRIRTGTYPVEGAPVVVSFIRDDTAIVAAEQRQAELERSLAQAQRMQALGQMASGIAHDFNNSLMAALPWADVLRRKFPDDESIQKATDQIRRAIHRAKEVTRHLLDFAQPKQPQKRRMSLENLVRQQVRMMRPAIPPEIEVTVDVQEKGLVEVDPNQVGQVLLNLALNSRDAMAEGGRIAFVIRRATPAEAHRWNVAAAEVVVLTVSDTGHGISQPDLDVIFNPFFTTKDVGKGSGLGLPVVMRIIQQHDGSVFVDSKPGLGTTFFIVLRRAADTETAPDPGPASTPVQTGRRFADRTFFLVDDEPAILEGLTAILKGEGARVESWSRGAELIEALASGKRPDLVVLDLGMPGISGKDVHRAIRDRSPSLPVVISTGYGDAERLDRLLADAKTRYHQKPYDAEALFATIETLIGSG